MRILLTGGAGYIGSHTAVELLRSGHKVCIFDNFENGHIEAIKRIKEITSKEFMCIQGDIGNVEKLSDAFSLFEPHAVIHMAGLKSVAESVSNPLKYYTENVCGSINLLQTMDKHSCKTILFSSSATVYGQPKYLPICEKHTTAPVNPYGRTKLMVENIMNDWSKDDRRACILRYFNPVGAHSSGLIGENTKNMPNNLLPYVAKVAGGKLGSLQIFGNDYDTRDGTGERDYIHVVDLALAHVAAIEKVEELAQFEIFNVGTGRGTTVKEILKLYEDISGNTIKTEVISRRCGDVASSFTSCDKANTLLNWKTERSLRDAVESSWKWQKLNPDGY